MQAPDPRSVMRSRRRRRLVPLVAAVVVLVAVVLIALSGGGDSKKGKSPSSPRTGRAPAMAQLNRALVTRTDLPSGAWVDDTAAFDDLLVGGLQQCTPKAKGPGARVPAEGLAARSEEHVFLQTNTGASTREVLDQVVAFHPGAAKAYLDRLGAAAAGCPTSNDALRPWTGPGPPRLGDQVVALKTSNVSYQGYELLVRVKDTIVEVAEVSDTTFTADHALLQRLAMLNVKRLRPPNR